MAKSQEIAQVRTLFLGSAGGRSLLTCRICYNTVLEPVVDLGQQPWCNNFLTKDDVGTEPSYPLRVVWCANCTTAQLDYTVPKEVMFGDHTYLSGVTRSLSEHFRKVAEELDDRFFKGCAGKSVLDIGSNDGTQLKHFKDLGYDVLGVESSKSTARIALECGVPTVNDYFNLDLARRLDRKFHVINAAGVFFHLEELHSATDGIRESLREDGMFVVQFLYMKRIVENNAFDQIYHEHLLYYNLETLATLLRRHGLELFDAYITPIHGGSVIAFAGHTGVRPSSLRLEQLLREEHESGCNTFAWYREFASRIEETKQKDLAFLNDARQKGKTVYGLGAPVKGNTLLNYFGVGPDLIECLVEKNRLRRGLYSPGMHIPVVMEDELAAPPDIYYVLAWNFRREILNNNQNLVEQGVEFYFPVNPRD